MKTIAILPARCGSKGIPYKNIHLIKNKPMIGYAIEAAKINLIDEIYVSTDCLKIAEIAKQYGAKIINRPTELATDVSTSMDCIKHTASILDLQNKDTIVFIQPTSPMINSNDIINGINIFSSGLYDTVISVTENHHILWQQNQNYLHPINHDPCNRIRRQDMQTTYYENGAFYILKVSNIMKYNCLHGYGNIGYVKIPKSRSFQIDDYEDIFIVESIMSNKSNE